ncbi:MAG TPA: DUF3857 domain-containing protein, partial [Candidatus Sulfotelmatobacter sp.]|nr:DUF3857 domain-containing protein [Candidatus Sulfotelmatobacter sp.]
WLGLLLSLNWLTAGAAEPFIPAHSTVVLLSGLPGDLESENTYRDQLQSWLQLLQAGKQAQKIIVLCDHPESVSLPAKTPGQVLKADRQSFLSLSQTLSATTNALVVIAWGHGGKQGATPVLHVRGPRLTPADFQTLAAQVPAAQSHWVLLFRGSGAFASQLAGPSRQILSSEAETPFASDPVGMPLLVKAVRAHPNAEVNQVADEFGRATAAWYAERSLARTEEPTLWAANQKPRLLAQSAAGGAGSLGEPEQPEVAAAQAAQSGAEPAPEKTPHPTADAQPPSKDLITAWEGITRVDPKKYPEADGVILRRQVRYTLASNPAIVSEQDEFIQVLTPEGKRFGDFDVSYSPPYEELNFLDCEVLRPDGELLRLDPDAIREALEKSVGDYQVGRRKIFSLPGVVPGAVLHVRYRTQWKNFPLPQISLEIPIGQEMAALDSTIQVSVPKDTPFHFALERVKAADPKISQTPYGATYTWQFTGLPPYQREGLVAPRQRPRLMISTFPNWPEFAAWYTRISQLSDTLTPAIADKAKELTRGAKTDREKVLALYNYVTSLRYVAVPMGVNSFRPHAAANVLANQFGDCKDKANLFNALLHSLNVEAHLVLVPRFSQAHETVPGLAFNHAISRVTLGNQILWVDTTDEVCRFGMLPPGDPGRKVLVIDGKTSALTQ